MKRRMLLLLVLVLASLFLASVAAAQGEPVGSCPGKFELHHMHEGEHEEHHIGLAQDINGDGWLCVKHLSNGLHVHMDNVLPLED